jgi:2-methylcitrate dehydratase PrpD
VNALQTQSGQPARQLASFAAGLTLGDIPAPVRERAKLHILDALGVGFASHAYPFSASAIAGVQAIGGSGSCTVLGHSGRFEVRDAALLNGILVHGLDFDDTHLGSIIHPTTTSLPVAMSLGESLGASGEELLCAFVAGAETSIRIGAAVKGGFHHVGYHATGVVSHFGSAIAAGRLIGLDADQLTSAQGIAGSTASGIQVFLEEGAWTKRMHPGWGAVAGITAARLAQHGFVGPTRPYEGKFGLFQTHLQAEAAHVDMGALTGGLGDEWRFGETALKPYPVCHFIHGCADAAIALHGEISAEEIVAVRAFLPEPTLHIVAEPAEAKERPTTEYEGKFSAQFVIASCLIKGRMGLPDLQPEAFADPQIMALTAKVKCFADPDSAFPTYFSGGLEVDLRDGRTLKRHVLVNSGAGERALSTHEVVAKFMAHATMKASAAQAEQVCEAVLNLEKVSATELMARLRQPR